MFIHNSKISMANTPQSQDQQAGTNESDQVQIHVLSIFSLQNLANNQTGQKCICSVQTDLMFAVLLILDLFENMGVNSHQRGLATFTFHGLE